MERCSKSKILILAAFAWAAASAQNDTNEIEPRSKERFLCQWRLDNAVTRDLPPPLFCDQPNLPFGTSLVEYDRWWGTVFEHNKIDVAEAVRAQFKSDWLRSPEKVAIDTAVAAASRESELKEEARQAKFNQEAVERADQQKQSELQQRRAELDQQQRDRQRRVALAKERRRLELQKDAVETEQRKQKFAATVIGLDNDELCAAYHETGYDSAHEEILRRNMLTPEEWQLVSTHKVAIGMRKTTLFCSWGRSRANRTLTAAGERDQYVYGDDTYVYVTNGRVTAIQDTR